MTDKDSRKLQAWWAHRQGLDGSLNGADPAAVLRRAGWARSVGGVGPYLTLFARAGTTRAGADASVASFEIHELPAARGCTYVVPARDYALALLNAAPFSGSERKVAVSLGVTDHEIETLCDAVEGAVNGEALDPEAIRERLGSAVRNLGDAGKKKGMITTLPLGLGLLQIAGRIHRVPANGRLDTQRFRYVRWNPSPLEGVALSPREALTELARKFFTWVGPATMKEFRWFSGAGVKASNDAVAPLGLTSVGGEKDAERLLLPEDREAFGAFITPDAPRYMLVSSLDSISATRRDVLSLVDERDHSAVAKLTFGQKAGGAISDLPAHAILDRGRVIGYWEFDADEREIVWMLFSGKKDRALADAVARTETFVRDELDDARSFSLDSPKSRKPKIDELRKLAR